MPVTRSRARRRGDAREVEFEGIRLVDGQVRMAQPLFAERGGEIAIDLDGVQLAARFEQGIGKRAAPGPDLHDQVAGPWRDRIDDAPHHRMVMEEVLAEALARPRLASRWGGRAGGGAAHGAPDEARGLCPRVPAA